MNLISLPDNSSTRFDDLGFSLSQREISLLEKFSEKNIFKLCEENPGLLVFPRDPPESDEIRDQESYLFKIVTTKENKYEIKTKNIAGFFGIESLEFHIFSKFEEYSPNQYFLHYMLGRLLNAYMLDLPVASGSEPILDFLFYLFPHYLKRAVCRGIFRTYRTFERNDDCVCGAIDFSRHLCINTPFRGRIACRMREHTGNNALSHLIRHTIEVMRASPRTSRLLTADEDIRVAVRTIIGLTPDFSRYDLPKVIAKNLRPLRHPFYTKYADLQNLCLKILRHERIMYGQSGNRITGVVVRVDLLWEKYLARVLAEADCGIRHGKPFTSETVPVYKNNSVPLTPDFFFSNLVMDAKYTKKSGESLLLAISKEDRRQLITYLYLLQASAGFLIHPCSEVEKTVIRYEDNGNGELTGYGGSIGTILFAIPQKVSSFSEFKKKIKQSEEDLKSFVRAQVNQPGHPR